MLDRTTHELLRRGKRIHLAKRPFDVLEYLVAERPRLVSRAELLQRYWAGKDVYEEALTRCVSSIRKALDDRDDVPRFLETRYSDGYRFIGSVVDEPTVDGTGAPAPVAPDAQHAGAAEPPRAGATYRRRLPWLLAACLVLVAATWWSLREQAARPIDPGGPLVHVRRLAVLPLDVSGIDEQLVTGINDELLQAVARIEGLKVISRASVARMAVEHPDPVDIGSTLGVQALLTGSVRQEEQETVIALRLLDSADAGVLWSYDARFDPTEVASSPRDIATKLAARLSARLRAANSQPPRDAATYALYLRARHYWNQRTAGSLREAIRLYEEAVRAEPDYADAHAGLAESWLLMPMYAGTRPTDTYPKARAAAETALRLNPESSRAHTVLAVVSSQFEWNWQAADEYFDHAIELNPNDATAYQWRAEAHCFRRHFDRCAADLREALALDPLSPMLDTAQGLPARFANQTGRARERFEAALRRHPSFALAELELGFMASAEGRWAEAIAHYERARPAMGPILAGTPLGYAYARAGRKEDARRILEDLTRLSATQYVPPIAFAHQALGNGDRELALAWLERALVVHDDFITQISVDHHYRELHDDPRFRAMMARVGTPLP